jgi:hypothetical protein
VRRGTWWRGGERAAGEGGDTGRQRGAVVGGLGLWGLFAISRKPRGVFATLQGGGV